MEIKTDLLAVIYRDMTTTINVDLALLYSAREACLARANRTSRGEKRNSQTTGAGWTGTLFTALYAGKKLKTKERYFL